MWRTAGSRNTCGIYSRSSAIYAVYTAGSPQSILCNNISYRNIQSSVGIYFGSVLNCQYRSIQAQVSIFQHSTIAALYKKRPRGVQRGAALCPFAVFSHSNVIYPLRASAVHMAYSREPQSMRLYDRSSAVHVAYSREPQSMRLYDRSSAIHAAYTAEVPQSMRPFGRGLRSPCGYYFPIQNLENISLTRSSPSDSPRIRPRLSYASVRSME